MSDRKPVGGGGARNANSLANLVPGAGAWQPGASPALTKGLRTRQPGRIVLDPVVRELEDALAEDLPIKAAGGGVPGHSRAMIELAAIGLLRVRRIHAWLALHGNEDERGRWRPENEAAEKAEESAARKLDRLGLSARSAASLGVDLSRMQALPDASTLLSAAAQEPDVELRRAMLERGGLVEPGGGDDAAS